jgi:hypothetical protein
MGGVGALVVVLVSQAHMRTVGSLVQLLSTIFRIPMYAAIRRPAVVFQAGCTQHPRTQPNNTISFDFMLSIIFRIT